MNLLQGMDGEPADGWLQQALARLRPKSWDALLPALVLPGSFDAGLAGRLADTIGLDWDPETKLPPTDVVPVGAPPGAAADAPSRVSLRPDAAAQAQMALLGPDRPAWLAPACAVLLADAEARAADDPMAGLEALRFRALLDPAAATAEFDRIASAADGHSDVARLDSLLATFEQDARRDWLDPAMQQRLQRWRPRAAARRAVLDAWDRTTFYQDRDTFRLADPPRPSHLVEALLDPDGLPLHVLVAGGGLGKTTFLRWLASHRLAVAEPAVPVAWIDFDHVDPLVATTRQDMIACLVAASLARWFPDGSFEHLAREAGAAVTRPEPAGASYLQRLASELKLAVGDRPVLVLLDTTELVLNAPAADLGGMVKALLALRSGAPGLRVLLCGRQLPGAALAVPLQEAQQHRLLPLPDDACRRYIQARGIVPAGELADAMIQAARGVPFHLGLCVDIVQGMPPDQQPDPQEFRRGPELTYLLERVIRRLRRPDAPDQPDQVLQWIVFYAAAPRRVTPGYVENVALPVLRAHGTAAFDVVRPEGFAAAPIPDPVRDTPASVWARLAAYAATVDFLGRESELSAGWLLRGANPEALVLHDRVRDAMRALLRDRYPLAQRLHSAAADHWQRVASAARLAEQPGQWAEATVEVVFHLLQGPAGEQLTGRLERLLRRAEAQQPPEHWARVAAEFRGSDYDWDASGRLGPFNEADAAALRFTAAISEARAWLQALGAGGGAERDTAQLRGLREALTTAASSLSAARAGLDGRGALVAALGQAAAAMHTPQPASRAELLQEVAALPGRMTPADRANLLLHGAEDLLRAGRPDEAEVLADAAARLNAGGNPAIQHRDDMRLCRLFMQLGKAGSALRPATRAQARAQALGRLAEQAEALLVVGWAQLAGARLELVLTLIANLDLLVEQAAADTAPDSWAAIRAGRDRLWAEVLLVMVRNTDVLDLLGPSSAGAGLTGDVRARLAGRVAADRGDTAGALDDLNDAAERFRLAGDLPAAQECELFAGLAALPAPGSASGAGAGTLSAAASLAEALGVAARSSHARTWAPPPSTVDGVLRILHRLPLGVSVSILRLALPVTVALSPELRSALGTFAERLSLRPANPEFTATAPVAALIARFVPADWAADLVPLAIESKFHVAQPEAMLGLLRARADLDEMPDDAFAAWAEAYVATAGPANVPALALLGAGTRGSPAKALSFAKCYIGLITKGLSWRAIARSTLSVPGPSGQRPGQARIGLLRSITDWLVSDGAFPEQSLQSVVLGGDLPWSASYGIAAAAVLCLYHGKASEAVLKGLFPTATRERLRAEHAAVPRRGGPEPIVPDAAVMQKRARAAVRPLPLQPSFIRREVSCERGILRITGVDEAGQQQVWEETLSWLGPVMSRPNEIPVGAIIGMQDAPERAIRDLLGILDLPTDREATIQLSIHQAGLASLPWEAIAAIAAGMSVVRLTLGRRLVRRGPIVTSTAVLALGSRGSEAERVWRSEGFAILPSADDPSRFQEAVASMPAAANVVIHLSGALAPKDEAGLPELMVGPKQPALGLRRLVSLFGVSRAPPVLLVLDVDGPTSGAEGWLALCRRNAFASALAQETGVRVASLASPPVGGALRTLAAALHAGTRLDDVPAEWARAAGPLDLATRFVPDLPALILPRG